MKQADEQAVWRELLAAAQRFRDLEPWEWMTDSDIFAVESTIDGQTYYCNVMGQGGEIYGLFAYPGDEGLATLAQLFDTAYEDGGESMLNLVGMEQLAYKFEILYLEDMEDTDLQPYRLAGLPVDEDSDEEFFVFQQLQPGYVPRTIDLAEARLLTEIIEQATELTLGFRDKAEQLEQLTDQSIVPHRLWREEGWIQQNLPEHEVAFSWPESPVPELTLRRAKQLPVVEESTYVFILSYLPFPIQDEPDARPYFPMIMIWLEPEADVIISQYLGHPEEIKENLSSKFLEQLLQFPQRPAQVAVNHLIVANALYPLAVALDMEVALAPPWLVGNLMNELIDQLENMERENGEL